MGWAHAAVCLSASLGRAVRGGSVYRQKGIYTTMGKESNKRLLIQQALVDILSSVQQVTDKQTSTSRHLVPLIT
jgi:hypothetical protein